MKGTHLKVLDIAGLDKAELLAAFYNASRPMGMGILQAPFGPRVMTREDAERVIREGTGDYPRGFGVNENLNFDYVYGRPLKINLSGDTVRVDFFEEDNEQPADQIISSVRLLTAV